jgi:hypothetical protein
VVEVHASQPSGDPGKSRSRVVWRGRTVFEVADRRLLGIRGWDEDKCGDSVLFLERLREMPRPTSCGTHWVEYALGSGLEVKAGFKTDDLTVLRKVRGRR